MRVGYLSAEKRVTGPMPESPARQRLHDSSVDNPIGVINPIPVITTFLMRARLYIAVFGNDFGEKDSGFFRGKQDELCAAHPTRILGE